MTASIATSSLAGAASSTATASSSTTATTGATEAQDRFLKLLVAQLSNQDPMNPMDNAQMTTQIAQINTVTGIQQLNDTMKSMASQMSAMQLMQAGNMVGHTVLAEGNQLSVADGKAVGAIEMSAAASNVKVQVLTAGGQVVDTVSLGALAAGQHGFSLDASGYPTNAGLTFKVIAANGSTSVDATALMRDTVVAVSNDTDGIKLNLQSTGAVPYSSIKAVL